MCSDSIADLIYVDVAECESGRILVIYNISYMLANKVWRNITIRQIRQTLVPPNFRCLRYNEAVVKSVRMDLAILLLHKNQGIGFLVTSKWLTSR